MPAHTPKKWCSGMLPGKHMPKHYWAKAASTVVYIMNLCTTSGVHELTPHEVYVGKKPTLSHLRVFRSIAYVHILIEKRHKLDPNFEKCIFVGYSSKKKGYKCFNPSTRLVRVSRDVIFDKLSTWCKPNSTSSRPTEEESDTISDDDIQPRAIPTNPSLTMMSGPSKQPSNQSTTLPSGRLDKGKGKMPEYEVDHPNERDLDVSALSLDSEFEVPIMQTLGIKKALTSTNENF